MQLTFTLANMDKDSHTVELLIDPWNEFGRYVAGVSMVGDRPSRISSGFDEAYVRPRGSGATPADLHAFSKPSRPTTWTSSRRTSPLPINIFRRVMPTPPMNVSRGTIHASVSVNHVFNRQI